MASNVESIRDPIFLVGATGTGKSAAAMELAREYAQACPGGAAILAMDAMQVYRGVDIGTSKPTAAERAEIPHGGLDLVEFGAPAVGSKGGFDVAQYLKHAAAFLQEQRAAGRRVIIVGGTGLYFRALTRGLCEAPQGSEELRAELGALSVAQLRARLGKIDPGMLGWLDAGNSRRLARAIEVMEATGRSLRAWQEETPEPLVREFTAVWIQRGKAELEARIAARVEAMFSQGWEEEVRGLVVRYGLKAVRAFPGIGYRKIAEALREAGQISTSNEVPLVEEGEGRTATELRGQLRSPMEFGNEGMVTSEGLTAARRAPFAGTTATLKRDITVATRRYAKRQLTWFAREPSLQAVMLTGNQVLRTAVFPDLF